MLPVFRTRIVRKFSSLKVPLRVFSEDEQAIQEAVSKFGILELAPNVKRMDEEEKMDPYILKSLFNNGFMGIEAPKEYGGLGLSFMSSVIAIEELARVDPSVSALCDIHNTLIQTIVREYGSEEMKRKYLPRLCKDTISSFCLSESSSGSDAFALKMRADPVDDCMFKLTGTKQWISNSSEAGLFLVFANVDLSKGYKGITCFLVEREWGVEVGKKEEKLGLRASSTCPLVFDGVEVPAENVVGKVGEGYKYAIGILNEGRIGIAAQMVGLAQGVFDKTMPYLFQRKQFNKFIGDYQGMQHQYAQIGMEIEAARLLTYNAARMKEAGIPFVKEAAMAKLYASQVAEKTASKCIEWMGGIGFTRDLLIEKFYRDSKIGSIYEGTSNIQLQTIAKLIAKQFSQ